MTTGGIHGESETIRFDAFTLDFVRRQVSRDGETLHLTPKAFDLLAVLVEAAPRVVTKRELYERLWKDAFVSDATLVSVIKELRRVFEDRSREHPIIRTVHRVGYAFCRTIETPTAASGAPLGTHWVLVERRRVPLLVGNNIIGRDADAVVRLNGSTVSRRHARIVISAEGAQLEDLGSKNGTKLEGRAVKTVLLNDGDCIDIGSIRLVYRKSTDGTTETQTVNR